MGNAWADCEDAEYAAKHKLECAKTLRERYDFSVFTSSQSSFYKPIVRGAPNVGATIGSRSTHGNVVAHGQMGLSNDRGFELGLNGIFGMDGKPGKTTGYGLDFGGNVELGRQLHVQFQVGPSLLHAAEKSRSFVTAGTQLDLLSADKDGFGYDDGMDNTRASAYLRAGAGNASALVDVMCGLPFYHSAESSFDSPSSVPRVKLSLPKTAWCKAKADKDLKIKKREFSVFASAEMDRRTFARADKNSMVTTDRAPMLIRAGVSVPQSVIFGK
jgi:hypothetical protein